LFKPGDLVTLRSNPGIMLPVIEVISGGAEHRYRLFDGNAKTTYYESQLQAPPLATEERRSLTTREMHAHLTALQILSPSTANLFSLRSGRVQFLPHQYRPVLKLIRGDRPRLLIADEVGVGKTIEAGLIIKELRARMDDLSVLVICPKALVADRKWLNEMKRFDEEFETLDGPLLRRCLEETRLEGEWPEKHAKAIVPFSLFDSDLVDGKEGRGGKKGHALLALDPPPKFDLVIIDEAHHIRNPATFLHRAVRHFCDHAKAVILLTATPVQLGGDDLFTLLNVLRPDLVIDQASFQQMAEPNRYINDAVRHCRAAREGWRNEALDRLARATETDWGRLFIRESPPVRAILDRLRDDSPDDSDRVRMTREIEGLYTFSHLINRTRRRDVGEFTTRKPETRSIAFTPSQQRLHDELLELIARILKHYHDQQNVKFMMTTIRRQAASCLPGLAPLLSDVLSGRLDHLELMEASDDDPDDKAVFGFVAQARSDVEALLERARKLDPHDPKVEAFVQVLLDKNKLPNNKALVFSTFRHTLAYLDDHARQAGLRTGLIHGDIRDDVRADLRRRFAASKDEDDAIDVLLSSEVGCEGLDFQFCDLLVNYDLPWNPMRIEQRIGRIDRYGQQSEAVAIVNFVTPGTVDADIYERCHWRIGVFQHAVGGGEEILGELTTRLHDIAENLRLTPDERAKSLQQLADNQIRQIREEEELESKQEHLFGLNVPSSSWRDEVEAAESFWLSPVSIHQAVATYLEARLGAGTDHLLGEKAAKTLRLNRDAKAVLLEDHLRLPRSVEPTSREWEKWLKATQQPVLSVTFDQETAAANPKMVHLSVTHPLVRQAARFLDVTEPKFFTFGVRTTEIPPGAYDFALYRWTKHGGKPDVALVAVADEPWIEARLLEVLQDASESGSAPPPDAARRDALEDRHYRKWSEAQADHVAKNRELVEHRIQSLAASHRAHIRTIEDQAAQAKNDKIRVMKESELARAAANFDRRLSELQKAAEAGDVRATLVVCGTVTVTR
jgi:superfamily II DNA or RNA helicase